MESDSGDSSEIEDELSDNEQIADAMELERPKIEDFYVLGKKIGAYVKFPLLFPLPLLPPPVPTPSPRSTVHPSVFA